MRILSVKRLWVRNLSNMLLLHTLLAVRSRTATCTGWTIDKSWFYSQYKQKIFFSPKCSDQTLGPPSLLFNWYLGHYPRGWGRPKHEANYHLHSNAKVKNEWSITPLPHMPSWRPQGQHFFTSAFSFLFFFGGGGSWVGGGVRKDVSPLCSWLQQAAVVLLCWFAKR